MHTDDEQAHAGPSNPPPHPHEHQETLSALWGKPGQGQLPFAKTDDTDKVKDKPAQRKRRKKDDGASQGRLVFGAGGMSVATPIPLPVEEEKKARGKGKRKNENGDAPKPTGRKRGRPPKNVNVNGRPEAVSSRLRVELSPDSPAFPPSSDPIDVLDDDAEIVVMGGTPPASQSRRRTETPSRRGKGLAHDPVEVEDTPRPLRTGMADDPVELDDTPRPQKVMRKIPFTGNSGKPAHAFFGPRSAATSAVASTAVSTAVSGTGTPTSIGSGGGSTTTSATNGNASRVHSFFSTAGKPVAGKLKNGWGNCKEGTEAAALWPGGEWPNHIGTSTSKQVASTSNLQRRQAPSTVDIDSHDDFWKGVLDKAHSFSPPSPARKPSTVSAPPFVLEHPAITAVRSDSTTDDGRESLCDRHRPREAAAVLGNEVEAEYLRNWLEALSIGQAESRTVIRRVPRKKNVNPDHEWIVDDAGVFGDPVEMDEFDDADLPEPYVEPYLGPGERPNSYPPLGTFVGNTIVLTGPSGTGKSAAVHAVATELGWDVFEVYPGIGQRTGANLTSLVGDVGKNHMVVDSKKKTSAASAAMAMFAKAKPKPKLKPAPVQSSQGSAADPIELDEDNSSEPIVVPDSDPVEPAGSKTKQSLILIDEADILFDEENSFWPAVVSLIKESRRPIVITCNDLAMVPTELLPLQVVLHFRAAPSYLAQPYLASIAAQHGFVCDVSRLFQDCTKSCLPDLIEHPLPPNGNEPEEIFDLRAALTQMQLDRQSSCERRECHDHLLSDDLELAELTRRLDAESFADAFVAPRPWARLETTEIDRFHDRWSSTPDDQHGFRPIPRPDYQAQYPTLAAYDMSSDIAATLVQVAGGSLSHTNQLCYDQVAYVRSLLPFLDPLIPLSSRLLPHPSLFTEVVPWVRAMVVADDTFEAADKAAAAAGEARINPRTGRVLRAGKGFERWLDLEPEARSAAVTAGEWATNVV